MFREMKRKKQALSAEECQKILTEEKRGVLSVIGDDGYPYGTPMNHFFSPEDGVIYFHGAKDGHKIDALKKCGKASFCVMDKGTKKEGDWALTFRSVIVFGRICFIEDEETVRRISRLLSLKFTSDENYIESEIRQHLKRTLVLALVPEKISGKSVHEA